MCGIAGFIDTNCEERKVQTLETIEMMLKALHHRGPDGQGTHSKGNVTIGMQRLSIIDIAGGTQPMESHCGRYSIVMNGEIFNFKSLRRDLESTGLVFRSDSDTEVALEVLARHGVRGASKFNGMFAIALYDQIDQVLYLIRDRFGVKPLYYAFTEHQFVFGSETAALFASRLLRPTIQLEALSDYLTLRFVPTSKSIWNEVHKLPPAHFLKVDCSNLGYGIESYWSMPTSPRIGPRRISNDDEFFSELFIDSVQLRMQADVPVGVSLSGGLDSSAIAAVASQANKNLHTYAVGFEGAFETNELNFAREVADFLGTDHVEIMITREDFLNFFPVFAGLVDEPMADLASIPFYFLARRAAIDVKVLLSGEGADEILAGYDFDRVLKSLRIKKVGFARHQLSKLINDRFAKQYRSNPIVMTNLFSENEKRDAIRSHGNFQDSLDYARVAIQSMRGFDSLERILNAYRQDWLVEDLLFRADRMSMANSIEVRTPFLDYRLVSWLSTLPLDRKVGFECGELVTKRLLRRFAKGRVPESVINRGKMGFSIPVYGWQDSDFAAWAAQGLLSRDETRVSEYLTHDFVEGVFGQAFGQSSTNLDRHRLWSLLTLEYWLRAWT